MFDPDGVRQERSGWRDEAISARHRQWGYDCPMVDIDFLAVEYNRREPAALVDYKACRPFPINFYEANYAVLASAANGMRVPFMVVFYSPNYWWFYVVPGNDRAHRFYGGPCWMSERDYVTGLYRLRGLPVPDAVQARLTDFNPVR